MVLTISVSAWAQVTIKAVVNAASFQSATGQGLKGGNIPTVPGGGALATAFCSGLTTNPGTFVIGTNAPDAGVKLQVVSDGDRARLQLNGYGVATGGNMRALAARGSAGSPAAVQSGDLLLYLTGEGYNGSAFNNGAYIGMFAAENWTTSANGAYMAFYSNQAGTNSTFERMRIDQNGNVGIGTTNPQHLLQVAGTIGAEEVLVTSTGADYVFQPGYHLRPLIEVAKFIEANHHLPDIPSAEEAQQKSVGVGEMEAKLLAKVEELTLHLIQQDKDNRELRENLTKENQELRDRIAQLEAHAAASGARSPLR